KIFSARRAALKPNEPRLDEGTGQAEISWNSGGPILTGANPYARAQKLLRIDGIAINAGFVVQMRARRATGRADRADHLADLDDLADLDVDLGEMAVAGRQSVAVVDLDHAAIAALPAR